MTLALCVAISTHIALPGNWNEVHPCIRYQNDMFIAGAYLNSEDTVSTYVGLAFERDKLFLEIGAVTGYSGATVAPMLRVGYEPLPGVRLFAAPGYADEKFGLVLGTEFSIDIVK